MFPYLAPSYLLNYIDYRIILFLYRIMKAVKIVWLEMIKDWFNCVNRSMPLSIFVFSNNFSINDDSAGTLSDITLSCLSLQSESCETAMIPYSSSNWTDFLWDIISNRYWSFQSQRITPFFLSIWYVFMVRQ